jgi:hypothetical protein
MKIKDPLEKLSKLDPNADVICYTEDESLLLDGHIFRVLEIESLDLVVAEKCRSNGVGTLKIGKSDASKNHVTLNITTDF